MNPETWLQTWQTERMLTHCSACDWLLLAPPTADLAACPHCGQALEQLDETAARPVYTYPPERTIPFVLTPEQARQRLTEFAKKARLAPPDLQATHLHGRMQAIYLPFWLVDADVQAQWQAEVGYNYQVVSHKEQFQGNQWRTQQVQETRVRWEPRLGALQRHYANQVAPALEEHTQIAKSLGGIERTSPQPYAAEQIAQTWVRLPNRPPEDAWSDAEVGLLQTAVGECQKAAAADHIRQFKWAAEFQNAHWTQQLYPVYTSYYVDEAGRRYGVYVQGVNGRLAGRRVVSQPRSKRWALGIGVAAGGLFALSLLLLLLALLLPPLVLLAGVGFVVACVTAVAALAPIIYAHQINNAPENRHALNLTGAR